MKGKPEGIEICGFEQEPNWPKMGPSLLIATCLIVAIRTARWEARSDSTASDREMEREIDHAVYVAGRVLRTLVGRKPSLFPSKKVPWGQPDGTDEPA